jgi:hypothetical protein
MGEKPAFICCHVFENSRPVLLVARPDRDWQLLCGDAHSPNQGPRLVGLNHLLDRDPSLTEILDLPVGWQAEREKLGGEWTRTRCEPESG